MEPKASYNPRRSNLYDREWVEVNSGLRRLKVPGGWLVVNGYGDAFVFIPDENYTWTLKSFADEDEERVRLEDEEKKDEKKETSEEE